MASLRRHIRIARAADDVWKVVRDAGSIAEWFPEIEKSWADGTHRHVEFSAGYSLEEEIVTCDDELRRFQYRVTEGPVPMDLLATVDVIEDGEGALVIYSTEITPDELAPGVPEHSGLQGLKAYLER